MLNGISVAKLNEENENNIQIHYNHTKLRLEVLILKNNVTDEAEFEANKDNTIVFRKGMPIGIGKVLENDVTFRYSAATRAWTRE